jgi:glycine betaine/proline transport system substrate-binding protein
MRATTLCAMLVLSAFVAATPASAQLTVLDQAQDAQQSGTPPGIEANAPPPPCGRQPINIARMSWPSAELLAEIHARVLKRGFQCDTRVTPGDLSATGSSMGSTGQPAVAPEMWVTRIAEVWNAGLEAQMLRPAAPTYSEASLEGWFVPDYLKLAHPELTSISDLAAVIPVLNAGTKIQFVSCPADWACSLINRNLIRALGLSGMVELVEPANRFEMDTLIAEAVSRQDPLLFYYWQPNAVLAQLGFAPLDMGEYSEEAAKCLAQVACPTPQPSAFASETVVIALSEWVFRDIPAIAAYFQRSSMALSEMNALLAQLNEPGATVEGVADRFVAERQEVWERWVSLAP